MEDLILAIKNFSHKGLKQFYYDGNESGLNPNHIDSIAFILDAVEASHHPKDLKAIYRDKFSEKKGSGKGVYSIKVNGNWRITFQIQDEGAEFLDYIDYHGKKIKAR
ncbi:MULTISPECIES: type II toxin-antitoxin system RelE/ParE family toxin [Vibrio]|jgi:proteic killer suppression protein|uniref:Plasmid maintenance system toxin protein HigB n=3 Tax=Vibrio TaxID=662 RepID=A0A822MXU6_9VIBR|nr:MULTISPECIES: type II toxin-antitoxin system RelE/ParE family toxin [Vibrio]MDH5923692.1 type II toxin-antitoxin system RelE/ParE family toxin [Vibrio splendidus]TCN02716.1 proteic killer suppression protein [Vibrio crassostreae]TCT42961.1 proteic killer suppression protein [Vibrio crassostreae]TCT45690.1 proteic killer suppression protein [Vibrio crassostreae]TCT48214.1 proteic killer suppression protein [Vibrio crassostreae]